ncbi:MAG: hypothetical protein S4CHLAM2_14860 [Chlamydiales bacterium]|nr:hypothetical protein [Chlamydiales bacterium]
MLHFKKILLATILLLSSSLQADIFYNDCLDECSYNCCSNGYTFAVWFDPMAVKPCQSNLRFVTIREEDEDVSITLIDHYLHPDWSFGFRLGGGIKSQCRPWSFRADYTYWENRSSGSAIATSAGVTTSIVPIEGSMRPALGFTTSVEDGDIATTSVSLKYDYSLFDLTAAWSCCICKNLELTPYGGFRGFWYKTDAKQINANSANDTYSPQGDLSTARNDYAAYGVVGGLRLNYTLCGCLNLYGSFGGSILAGENTFCLSEFASQESTPLEVRKEELCLYNHSLEGAWGITYDTCLCGLKTHLGLGYEVTRWNEFLPSPFGENTTGTSTLDDVPLPRGLFIQAITARLGIAY